jgi:hypothetical protein
LSYFNGTTLRDVVGDDEGHEVRCIISIENWSRWMLSFPVTYTLYGDFQVMRISRTRSTETSR